MTKARKPEWPKELSEPIAIRPAPSVFGSLEPGRNDAGDQMRAEMQRRIGLIAKQIHSNAPSNWNDEWAFLLFKVCDYWAIPALQSSAKRGPAKFWTDQKLCELFGDVQALKKANSRMSEIGACKFIAKNAAQFGKRYLLPRKTNPTAWASTLHRQLVAAKKTIKTDHMFRQINLGDGILGLLNLSEVPSDPELARVAIERFAFTRNKPT